MKRRAAMIVIAAVLLVAASGCGAGGNSADPDDSTVDVAVVQLPIFAPLYVAQSKGYFKAQGLTVKLQNVKSGQDAVPLASSGKLDAVVAGFSAGMFSAIQSGLNVKVVGSMGVSDGNAQRSPTDLVVSKKSGIKNLAGLKGKKVAAAGGVGATGGFLLDGLLQRAGMSLKDVSVVNLGNPDMPTALKNGSVDAALVSAPFSKMAISDGTGTSLGVPAKGVSGTGVLYGGAFASSPNAQKFFSALAHGARDLQGSNRYSAQNISIIAKATGQSPAQVKAVPLYTWLPDLAPLPQQLTAMQKVWINAGAIDYKTPLPASKYVNSTFSGNATG